MHGERIWFVCANGITESDGPKVLVEFFDMDGRSVCKGVWVRDRLLRWMLAMPVDCSVETRTTR